MKISTLIGLVLLVQLTGTLHLFGQKTFKEYLDKDWHQTSFMDSARYYREGFLNEEGKINGTVKTYSARNLLLRKIEHYNNGKPDGEEISYYSNGQKKEEGEWERTGSPKYIVHSFWDSTGIQTITNGTGELLEYSDNHIHVRETYINGALIKGVFYGDKEYVYHTYREQMPEFPGGAKKLFDYLNKNIRYPKEARKKGIRGRISVSFVIGSDGKVKDVTTKDTPLGYGLEEEAIHVVSEMPAWQPGLQYGRPVPIRYTMPITFSL